MKSRNKKISKYTNLVLFFKILKKKLKRKKNLTIQMNFKESTNLF